jgi:hypothetical protein
LRDAQRFKESLRHCTKHSHPVLVGLTTLILRQNRLGFKFAKELTEALKYDDYMKALDVRDNLLTTKIIENKQVNFFAIVKRNESITNLDFRNNECYTDDFRFNLSQIMLKNISTLRASGLKVLPYWLNKGILMIDEAIAAAKKSEQPKPNADLGCGGH